jgi:hypothetical protein
MGPLAGASGMLFVAHCEGPRLVDGVRRRPRAPPSPTLPRKLRGGGRSRAEGARRGRSLSPLPRAGEGAALRPRVRALAGAVRRLPPRDRILPSPRETSGEGSGRGPRAGASGMLFVARCEGPRLGDGLGGVRGRPPPRPSPANCAGEGGCVQKGAGRGGSLSPLPLAGEGAALRPRVRALAGAVRRLPPRDRILPSPRGTSGEGSGEGPPRGRQRDAFRRTSIHRHPNLPQQFWGRWASNASPEGTPAVRREPRLLAAEFSLPHAVCGEGRGGGRPRYATSSAPRRNSFPSLSRLIDRPSWSGRIFPPAPSVIPTDSW